MQPFHPRYVAHAGLVGGKAKQNKFSVFYQQELLLEGLAPKTCEATIVEKNYFKTFALAEYVGHFFPIQDLLGLSDALKRENPMEERINIPAIVQHYWRYRLHLNLEDLIEANDLNGRISLLLQSANR